MNVWVVILAERAVAWGRRTRAGPTQIRMSVLRRAPPWRAGAIEPATHGRAGLPANVPELSTASNGFTAVAGWVSR